MKPVALAGLAAAALLLFLFPGIDLAFSRLFYSPDTGFIGAGLAARRLAEESVPLAVCALAALVAVAGLRLARSGRPLWRLDRKALVFIVVSTALGPGLVANVVLKDHWGRARPFQVAEFGGARQFTAAPLRADQCAHNCSFVSGHAALAFSLIGIAWLLPTPRARRLGAAAALGYGAAIGLLRIAAGHHFLSDVFYAGLVSCGTSRLAYWAIVTRDWGRALPAPRVLGAAAAVAAAIAASIAWIDRPLAWYLHDHAASLQPLFHEIARFGLGYPYLILFAVLWLVVRRRGGDTAVPVFLFAAVAAAGLATDILKVVFGRTRPKLLFLAGQYDFTWFGFRADLWSFPSGHATTAAALVAALWYLWPRYLPIYLAGGLLIAASRIVTGAHYLSDTIAAAALAAMVTRALAAAILHDRRDPPAV